MGYFPIGPAKQTNQATCLTRSDFKFYFLLAFLQQSATNPWRNIDLTAETYQSVFVYLSWHKTFIQVYLEALDGSNYARIYTGNTPIIADINTRQLDDQTYLPSSRLLSYLSTKISTATQYSDKYEQRLHHFHIS